MHKMQKQHSNYLFSSPHSRTLFVAMLVIIVGLVTAISPFGRWLEEDIGLPWLFQLRGELPTPNEVAVISIDQNSARELNFPAKPRKWPRHYHGMLVGQLTAHGATAIGFDIIFDEPRNPEHNQQFARAMQQANNVVLFQYLRQEIAKDNLNGLVQGRIEKLVSPIPILAESAHGLSPFPLPKVPAKVNHFILYKESLGNMPTLPVTMLQLYARSVHGDLVELINQFEPAIADKIRRKWGNDTSDRNQHQGIQHIVSHLRDVFRQHPELGEKIKMQLAQSESNYSSRQLKQIKALLYIYTAPESLYLNFYGGYGSIKTIPYHQVLSSDPAQPTIDVKDKAVFVGFSEQFQPAQKDGFYTVFTEENSGSDISGVEIIATAFANLLEQNAITVPDGHTEILLLVAWAILISVVLRFGSALIQLPITILLALGHGGVVYYSFVVHAFWLPFLTPIIIQLLLASLVTFLWKYRQLHHERQIIREAFGYHLPIEVVDQIAEGVNHVTRPGEKVHGIVMATDAQQYTTLSEQLTPDQLQQLMNEYYETLFKPIRDHHGIVSDVVGDAAMAIWATAATSREDDRLLQHQRACLAALVAQKTIDQFNQARPQNALPTRIGLDSGEIVVGHIGALDHYEYRAIGDIVNTASRIEGVNKILGTRIIISETVLNGTQDLLTRDLGRFKLAGKNRPVRLYELMGTKTESRNSDFTLIEDFHLALEQFQGQAWQAAYDAFQQHADDGPSHYYAQLCQQYLQQPPTDFAGYITLTKK